MINGPSLDPSDPFANDEDAALKALARKLENKYVSDAYNDIEEKINKFSSKCL